MSDRIEITAGVKAYPLYSDLVFLAVHTDAEEAKRLLDELDVETECNVIIEPNKYTTEELAQAKLEAQKLKKLFEENVNE